MFLLVTLQLVFFDGEEAFRQWQSLDSLYGSRHLCAKWEIEALVLLDLLGHKSSIIYPYFYSSRTRYLFDQLLRIHKKLKAALDRVYFSMSEIYGGVEDDHIPFQRRNVPIVHLIPTPFPPVWHHERDNLENVDLTTLMDLTNIFYQFALQNIL